VRERVTLLVKLAVAAGLITWLLRSGRVELGELARVGERWHWLLLAQLPLAGLQLLLALRWNLLLRALGIAVRLRDTAALSLTGWFFNQMLLGTTGGDLVKAYAIAVEHPQQRTAAITSIALDRLLGLSALLAAVLLLALANLDLVQGDSRLALFLASAGGAAVALVTGASVILSPRVRARFPEALLARVPFKGAWMAVGDAAYAYRRQPRTLALAFALSFGVHAMTLGVNALLTRALVEGPIDWTRLALLTLMAHLAMGLPINPPGALGTAEALYQLLFQLAGIAQGGLVAVLQRLSWYAWALPGALLYVARRTRPPA
jgi:glycosyltransferase 2 family protein